MRCRISPLVWVLFGRSTILLPAQLLRKLNRPQRTALLLHELAHLRRRDHWTKLVELAAVSIYWWLPTAWWADVMPIKRPSTVATRSWCRRPPPRRAPTPRRLLATIDFLADAHTPLPLGASGFSQFGYVSRRIEMILEPQPHRRQSLFACLVLVALAVAVLPLSVERLWAAPIAATAQQTAEPNPQPSPAVESQRPVAPNAEDAAANEPVGDNSDPLGEDRELTENNVEREFNRLIAQLPGRFAQTNFNRRQAAWQQVEAIQAAYEAKTVTLDQLLESERRLADAKMKYAREVCEICPDLGRRKLLLAEASLIVGIESVQQARQTWMHVHKQSRTEGPHDQQQEEAAGASSIFTSKVRHNDYWPSISLWRSTPSKRNKRHRHRRTEPRCSRCWDR